MAGAVGRLLISNCHRATDLNFPAKRGRYLSLAVAESSKPSAKERKVDKTDILLFKSASHGEHENGRSYFCSGPSFGKLFIKKVEKAPQRVEEEYKEGKSDHHQSCTAEGGHADEDEPFALTGIRYINNAGGIKQINNNNTNTAQGGSISQTFHL
ncbi:uncharacterized protein [Typha latifolia]|uniref:uncharacterized protein n=1 Tax=Typha latifolia TaxID=4733 RepID=UPI003C2C41AF